jgi:hypothetical protein
VNDTIDYPRGAGVFGAVFDGLGAVKAIELYLPTAELSPWTVLILMKQFYLMGTFLDDCDKAGRREPHMCRSLGIARSIWYGILIQSHRSFI